MTSYPTECRRWLSTMPGVCTGEGACLARLHRANLPPEAAPEVWQVPMPYTWGTCVAPNLLPRFAAGVVFSIPFAKPYRVRLFDLETGTIRLSGPLIPHSKGWSTGGLGVDLLARSPDGRFLVAVEYAGVQLMRLPELEFVARYDTVYACGAAFSPDSRRLAFVTSHDGLFIYDTETGEQTGHVRTSNSALYNFPGGYHSMTFAGPDAIYFGAERIDLKTSKVKTVVEGFGAVWLVSRSGDRIFASTSDGGVYVYELPECDRSPSTLRPVVARSAPEVTLLPLERTLMENGFVKVDDTDGVRTYEARGITLGRLAELLGFASVNDLKLDWSRQFRDEFLVEARTADAALCVYPDDVNAPMRTEDEPGPAAVHFYMPGPAPVPLEKALVENGFLKTADTEGFRTYENEKINLRDLAKLLGYERLMGPQEAACLCSGLRAAQRLAAVLNRSGCGAHHYGGAARQRHVHRTMRRGGDPAPPRVAARHRTHPLLPRNPAEGVRPRHKRRRWEGGGRGGDVERWRVVSRYFSRTIGRLGRTKDMASAGNSIQDTFRLDSAFGRQRVPMTREPLCWKKGDMRALRATWVQASALATVALIGPWLGQCQAGAASDAKQVLSAGVAPENGQSADSRRNRADDDEVAVLSEYWQSRLHGGVSDIGEATMWASSRNLPLDLASYRRTIDGGDRGSIPRLLLLFDMYGYTEMAADYAASDEPALASAARAWAEKFGVVAEVEEAARSGSRPRWGARAAPPSVEEAASLAWRLGQSGPRRIDAIEELARAGPGATPQILRVAGRRLSQIGPASVGLQAAATGRSGASLPVDPRRARRSLPRGSRGP